jgi:hypothetical protein
MQSLYVGLSDQYSDQHKQRRQADNADDVVEEYGSGDRLGQQAAPAVGWPHQRQLNVRAAQDDRGQEGAQGQGQPAPSAN